MGSAIDVTLLDAAEMGLRGLGTAVKREGLEVVVKKMRRALLAVGGGDRRGWKLGLLVGITWGRDLVRIRDRRLTEGGEKAVEKRAEASIANAEKKL